MKEEKDCAALAIAYANMHQASVVGEDKASWRCHSVKADLGVIAESLTP